MLLNLAGSGHPTFRCTSALERGELRSKGGGKKSIQFSGSTQNIELLLQMVISVNQPSIGEQKEWSEGTTTDSHVLHMFCTWFA